MCKRHCSGRQLSRVMPVSYTHLIECTDQIVNDESFNIYAKISEGLNIRLLELRDKRREYSTFNVLNNPVSMKHSLTLMHGGECAKMTGTGAITVKDTRTRFFSLCIITIITRESFTIILQILYF